MSEMLYNKKKFDKKKFKLTKINVYKLRLFFIELALCGDWFCRISLERNLLEVDWKRELAVGVVDRVYRGVHAQPVKVARQINGFGLHSGNYKYLYTNGVDWHSRNLLSSILMILTTSYHLF